MSSRWGQSFVLSTFGESHGAAMGGVIDGVLPKTPIDCVKIQKALDARKPGQSRFVSQRNENDEVELLSGVLEGVALGSPIGFVIRNQDARSGDYEALKSVLRPGHADYTYQKKYGIRDPRGGGRASARETANWVVAGEIARQVLTHALQQRGQETPVVRACVLAVGEHRAKSVDWSFVKQNPLNWPEPSTQKGVEDYLTQIRKDQDSIGARVYAEVLNPPVGLGEPVFDKFDAELSKLMMAIPAVKGVEFGAGFKSITQKGSQHRDAIMPNGFATNHAGGVLGGITTGQDISLSVAFKPTSSIPQPIMSIDKDGEPQEVVVKGRHDPCVGIRAVPVVEGLIWMALVDFWLRLYSQNKFD